METLNSFEPAKPVSIVRRMAESFIASLQLAKHQLATSDQNPHEGRLRASIMPSKYIRVPDYPPANDEAAD